MVLIEGGVLFLGGKIFSTIVNDTTETIVNIIETSLHHNHKDVHEVFTELDLDVRLNVINSLINHISNEIKTNKDQSNKANHNIEPINKCLEALYNVIKDINSNINLINKALQDHKQKYFSYWRHIDIDAYIDNARKLSDLLEKRFDLLVKVIKF